MHLSLGKKRRHLLVFALYFALSILLTYPLITKFTTHVVGSNIDEGSFVWNIWWVKHAVIDLHSSPLYSDYIFYPLGVSTVYYTLTLLNGLLSIPLQLVSTPIVANNLTLLLSLSLSGFGTYLLALSILGRYFRTSNEKTATVAEGVIETGVLLAAIVAGIVYAFPASRFVYAALGQANLTSTAWIPLYALFLLKAFDPEDYVNRKDVFTLKQMGRRLPYAVLAGIFFLFSTLTDLTYAAFLGIFTALYVLWAVAMSRNKVQVALAGIVSLAIVGFSFLIGGAPILIEALREAAAEGDYLSNTWGGADRFSADLLSLFIPTHLHPIWGGLSRQLTSGFTDIPIVYVGYSVTLLAAIGVFAYRRKLGFWVGSSLSFLLLELGPILHINGISTFDFDGLRLNFGLPFILLHYIPLVKANRVPNRFSIMFSLCVAMLVAFGLVWIFKRFAASPGVATKRKTVLVTILASSIILFENLSIPLPISDAAPSEIYRTISQDPGDFSILQLPLGWRNSYGIQGSEKTILQSYQWMHGKRILGGNTSRNPDFKFSYFAGAPILSTIINLEEEKPSKPDSDYERQIAPVFLSFYDIRYVVVHRDYVKPAVENYIASILPLENAYDDGSVAGYRVKTELTALPERIEFGTPISALYRVRGWGTDEVTVGNITMNWVISRQADILLPIEGKKDYNVGIRMLPYVFPGAPPQKATVEVDNQTLAEFVLEPGWQDYSFDLPAGIATKRLTFATIKFTYAVSPQSVDGSSDKRTLAAAVDAMTISPKR